MQTNGVVDPVKQRNDQRIRLVNNVRYFPHRLGNLRSQALNEWQMSFVKRVHITPTHPRPDQHRAAERVQPDDLRAPTTDPTNANFGKVTSQFNLPQSMQIAFKLLF